MSAAVTTTAHCSIQHMAHPTAPPPVQRFVVLGAVLALHLGLIMLVLASSAGQVAAPLEPAMSAVMVLAADQVTQPAPPALPSRVAETRRPLTDSTRDIVDLTSSAAPTGRCATLEQVANGLLADPLALGAILRAPPETRSIADAIVIWNAGWSESASAVDSSLGAVRAATEQSLRALDDKCLDEPVAGPRFIPVTAGARTMLIVIGSGIWRWRDLIAEGRSTAGALDEQNLDQIIAPSPRNKIIGGQDRAAPAV